MRLIQALTEFEPRSRRRRESQRGECCFSGCSQSTTGNKPYCVDHLDELPYVQALRAEIARREKSSENDPSGPDAADVLRQLEVHGAMTVPRLSREIELAPDRLLKLLRALERKGHLQVIELRDERGKRRRIVQPATALPLPKKDTQPLRTPA